MQNFNGKTVIVTGAADGIGRASALRFAELGASVVVADINQEGIENTARQIGAAAIAVSVDVTDSNACDSVVAQAVASFGRVDALINCAGISGDRALTHDLALDDWQRVIAVNLHGTFYCMKAAIPEMLKVGGGAIVNIASIDGLVGMASIAHYTASKHAVVGLTKACALEYGAANIRCVAVAPGFIDTAMTQAAFSPEESAALAATIPMQRPANPTEVANLVTWLASDEASYVSGSVHTIDAGLTAGFGKIA